MQHFKRFGLLTCASAAAICAIWPAQAQVSAPGAIEQVTVSAQKRDENIQDVPVSVVAYSQTSLEDLHVNDVTDIVRLTPGLSTQFNAGSTPIIAVRGIASTSGQSTTGIYIDDTPIQVRYIGAGGTAGQGFPSVFDLDRVEVLRGPQGTLFGAGSEGGTVRFITESPSFSDFSGHARAEYGVNEVGAPSYQFGAAGGGPIIDDTLAFRISGYVQQDGGWIDQRPYPEPFVSQKNVNTSNTIAINGALTWAVTDALTITPKVFYQDVRMDGTNTYNGNASNPAVDNFVNLAVVPQAFEDQFVLASVAVNWDLGWAAIVSNTSFLDRKLNQTKDYTLTDNIAFTGDYTGPISPAPGYNQNPQQQVTQELRLQSEGSSWFTWVIGGFYQKLSEHALQPVTSTNFATWTQQVFNKTVPEEFGVGLSPGDLIYIGNDTSADIQYAGFGQADINITDQLKVTAGVRYGVDQFKSTNLADGPFNGGPSGSSGSGQQSVVTPKLGIQYKPSEDLMVYASAARGYRPGGPNTPVPNSCSPDLNRLGYAHAPDTYGADTVWSYETGVKGEALDDRLAWDASAYYINWSKPQTLIGLPTCLYSIVTNAGNAVSKGVDLSLRYAVTNRLSLQSSVGYDDARYTATVPTLGSGNVVTAGELLPAPAWQLLFGADYEIGAVVQGINAYVHADDTFSGAYTIGSAADALFIPNNDYSTQAINQLGLRFGFRTGDWDASLFASNLLNDHPVVSNSLAGRSLFFTSTIAPRVIGLTAKYRF